jgi:multidrug efflux pump subunit AcrB
MAGPFLRNPRLTILALGLIVVAGLGAFAALPRQEDPALSRRFATITTFWPGASAARVESLVTEPIERRLQELHEVRELDSVSRMGVSLIAIELEDRYTEADVDEVWSKVRDRLADAARELPGDALAPAFEDRTTTALTLLVGFAWEGEGEAPLGLLSRLAEELANRLRNVAHTKETEVFGEAQEEIRVTVDPAALAAVGVTALDVADAIARADAKLPAGALRGASDLQLEVRGELTSLERVRAIPLRQQADRALRIGDLAQVEKTVREPAAAEAWLDGRRGVAVGATMEPDHRVDRWAARAHEVVEAFRAEVPPGVRYALLFDQSVYTEQRLVGLGWNLAGSVAVVVAVLFVTMGVRSALLVSAALPLTVLASLAALNVLGVPLHQMSITGLIVAIGILIDNAIIAVDELHARLRAGSAPAVAASDAARHLRVPLAASTLTTVLAFLPIVLMPGGAGEFVGPIAIGVIVSVTASFALALTLVPALAAFFAPTPEALARGGWRQHGFSHAGLAAWFRRSLEDALHRPARGIAIALALPLLGFAVGRTLPEQFFPANDRDQFQIQLALPSQAAIEETRAAVLRAQALVRGREEVVASHWFLGESTPRVFYNQLANNDGVPSYAGAFVTTRSAAATERILPALQAELAAALPEARVIALPFEQGPPFDAPIEVRLVGPDLDTLRALGEQVREVMSATRAVTYTTAKLLGGEPRLRLDADESAARLTGLRLTDVARQLQGSLEGAVGGTLLEATEELPVRVRVAGADRASPAAIGAGRVLAPGEAAAGDGLSGVPVAALSRWELVPELAGITRRDGERTNTVQAYLLPYALISESLADFRARLAASSFALPAGYRLELGGESAERDEALTNLAAFALPLFVVMAGAIVLSFDSFRMAGIIFAVAMLSVGLGQLGVWAFGHPMGFVAIVGTMGLVGVAINDSILVLSSLREHPAARAGELGATVEVVMQSTRHVFATTLTTMGGFLPLLLFGGRFWPPMAAAIAVGVGGATIVALYGVPVAHRWLALRRAPRAPRGAWRTPRVDAPARHPVGAGTA